LVSSARRIAAHCSWIAAGNPLRGNPLHIMKIKIVAVADCLDLFSSIPFYEAIDIIPRFRGHAPTAESIHINLWVANEGYVSAATPIQ
jgi:hypothetical protein